MTGQDVVVPGDRDVRATLDPTDDGGEAGGAPACVVACPPHPQQGGSRSDERLRAVADALTDCGVDCLRFDYGPWGAGHGERTDAGNALAWARDRYDAVGLFGYSFGAGIALVTAAERAEEGTPVGAVAALAPVATLADGADVAAAVERLDAPTHVSYGRRDRTVDWPPVVDAAREFGGDVREWNTDHGFAGWTGAVGDAIAAFLADALG